MSVTASAPARFDVLGIGNAVVDVIAQTQEGVVEELGLAKGAMTLIDDSQVETIYGRMGPGLEMSGGSCANTMAALAAMESRAAYIGRVKSDDLGKVFAHDIRATGVSFDSRPATDGPPTARCLIFVHEDAHRTMATYLGACVELGPDDVDPDLVAAAQVTYLEGYLWDRPAAKEACLKAARTAHENGREIALTLSDPFCVDRWREEFLELIESHVDILFANEAEIVSLFQVASFDEALERIRPMVKVAALTRSEQGSVIATRNELHHVEAARVSRVVDTTGAGDLYAAGFLRGYTQALDLAACGRLGALAAGTIIQNYGARAEEPLAPLVARAQQPALGLAV